VGGQLVEKPREYQVSWDRPPAQMWERRPFPSPRSPDGPTTREVDRYFVAQFITALLGGAIDPFVLALAAATVRVYFR
jgi:hypothetical protein